MKHRMQSPWMATVQVGDVLRTANGTLRVAREVSRYKDGALRSITFAIRHCSWTHRPITTYGYTDLRLMGYEPIGVRVALNSKLDRELSADIADHRRQKLHCCDVRGVLN